MRFRDPSKPATITSLLLMSAALHAAGPPSPHEVAIRRVSDPGHRHDRGSDREGGIAGGCQPVVVAHTSSDFEPGTYIAQGGIIEGEILATSHVLPAEAFPVRIDLVETLFATSSTAVSHHLS